MRDPPPLFPAAVHARGGKAHIGAHAGCQPGTRATLAIPESIAVAGVPAPPYAMKSIEHRDFTLSPEDNQRLANLSGPFDGHLRQIELKLGVEIANRGHVFRISGPAEAALEAQKLVEALYAEATPSTCA